MIALSRPAWLEAVMASYQQDAAAQQLLTKLALDPTYEEGFSISKGVIKFQGQIWIGHNTEIQESLITTLHDSAAGGHSGFHATYNWVRMLFAWRGLKIMVKQFVQQCLVCQKAKTETISPAGLLQPLPIPKRPWAVIFLNFIKGLPKSQGYDIVLVVVDKFSKYSHFIPMKHPYTTLSLAMAFMHNIFKLHGLPLAIISDRDRVFTNNLWQEMFN